MKRLILLFLLSIFFFDAAWSTGPSYIHAEMRPISVNDKGEILCRTRFEKNPMGGHYPMDIEYGVCVITSDTIVMYGTHLLQYQGYPTYESYEQHQNFWDSIFYSPFDKSKLSDIEYMVANHYYKFSESNVEPYLVNDTLSVEDMKRKRKIDLTKISQKSLYGGTGIYPKDYLSRKVILLYDFGHLLIIQNNNGISDEGDEEWTIAFNYPSGFLFRNENGEDVDVGYDYGRITGILYKE
ncbi:hypothetical protein [Dysgonomonas sp. 25]|uniref:hypothetical protein n=1 Tax=Dysgonomonas sp. 25 TaxID=2302933 RepID=UPI0013D04A3A|nr:hypothetical protein [Dysgonomonas sp. 25]NDV68371.1 hypothetical protein [Dysgonomonas sp. 25]